VDIEVGGKEKKNLGYMGKLEEIYPVGATGWAT
jgi:hypothetical protein